MKILVVCTGNICRSPTAEAVLRALVEAEGLAAQVTVASAGTHDYHVGEAPDARAREHARRRGYRLDDLRASQVRASDFDEHELVLAMDRSHLAHLLAMCPPQRRSRVRLFLDFAPACGVAEVPDPYYGRAEGFERVLDLIEAASRGLVSRLKPRYLSRVST